MSDLVSEAAFEAAWGVSTTWKFPREEKMLVRAEVEAAAPLIAARAFRQLASSLCPDCPNCSACYETREVLLNHATDLEEEHPMVKVSLDVNDAVSWEDAGRECCAEAGRNVPASEGTVLALLSPGNLRDIITFLYAIEDGMSTRYDVTIQPWTSDSSEWIAVLGTQKKRETAHDW